MPLLQVDRRAVEVRTPGEVVPGVARLAVVRNDRLGDLVVTVPAIAALRATYPDAHLSLVASQVAAPLARLVAGVDEVIEDPGTLPGLTASLREAAPDLLVVIATEATNAMAGLAAQIPHRVGSGYRATSLLFERTVNEHRSAGDRHEVEYALSYAHRCGAAGGPAIFDLIVPEHQTGNVGEWLRSKGVDDGFVVLHPGSAGSCPRWPTSHFLALARGLLAAGRPVVISIGPADAEESSALERALWEGSRPFRFESGIPALAALLGRAALVVSNSTGPLHLAAALGASTLAIHAPWATCGVGRWGPYAANGWALEADLPGAREWSRAERARRSDELMSSLSPEVVLEAALGLLDRRA